MPLDEVREHQEFWQRPEGEQRRIEHIAGRMSATYSHDDPAFFITCTNRIFREEPDLAARILEDFVPAPPAGMDRSRSPRNLSDEAGLLRRLVEQVGADAAEGAVTETGGHGRRVPFAAPRLAADAY